jgi:N-acetylglutamate synthase-like GNAT family acetyltransferase
MPIRSASPSDFEEIRNLLEKKGLPTADLTSSDMQRFFVCQADEPISDRLAMLRTVAILPRHRLRSGDGEICGTVGFETYGPEAVVRSLAAQSEQGDEKTKARLLRRAEQEARKGGAERLYVWTTNFELFKWQGYEEVSLEDVPTPITRVLVADRFPEATLMRKHVELGASRPPKAPARTNRSEIRTLDTWATR